MKTKHKNLLRHAKGFRGRAKNCYRIAVQRVLRSWQHAYVGRKLKKRQFRSLWILQVNAAVREHGMSYSRFMNGAARNNITLNRKVLAELAQTEPFSFMSVVETVKLLSGHPTVMSPVEGLAVSAAPADVPVAEAAE